MNKTQFQNDHLSLEVTAHEDKDGRLLMIRATAAERPEGDPEPPIRLAVVIDRSGSMSGRKLDIAKRAAAGLIEHLRSEDLAAAVVYDDEVNVLFPLSTPSPQLSRTIGRVHSGGSTNLYGGWVTGAKLLVGGGRVLLLSDGLANVGRFSDAANLSGHAKISYERYGVATSTVGIGEDFDEALMAGMARAGGGSHYFAHSPEAILEAFKRERYLVASLAIDGAKVSFGNVVVEIGQLLEGETKTVAVRVDKLPKKATLTYMDAKTEAREKAEIELPQTYANVPLATATMIDQEAAEMMDRILDVQSQDDARRREDEIRTLLLKATNHELADVEPLVTTRALLENALRRVEGLAVHYDVQVAQVARKYAAQTSHNLREKMRSFSGFAEDDVAMERLHVSSCTAPAVAAEVDPAALNLRPADYWLAIPAAPLRLDGGHLWVGVADPRDGFLLHRLQNELGLRVRSDHRRWTPEEIERAIRAA